MFVFVHFQKNEEIDWLIVTQIDINQTFGKRISHSAQNIMVTRFEINFILSSDNLGAGVGTVHLHIRSIVLKSFLTFSHFSFREGFVCKLYLLKGYNLP